MNKKIIIFSIILLIPTFGFSKSIPGVITDFCEIHFNGQIANIGEPFNVTDIKRDNLPFRRIIDFAVTSSTAYLWYEHGGRGYHQHLETVKPKPTLCGFILVTCRLWANSILKFFRHILSYFLI